jgi:sortase A
MTHRLDFTRLFVIGLALISLLAPNYGEEEHSQPLSSPPILLPTQTATATPLTPTATRRPAATTAPPTSEPRPSATPVEPTSAPQPTLTRVVLIPTPPKPSPPPPESFRAPPTRLRIPAINLDAPVVTVGFVNSEFEGQPITTWIVPDTLAAGWHHTSAPLGGAGNTVLNGHQDVHGGVFRDLARAQVNDEIIVYAGDTAHCYRIAERHFLEEEGQSLQVRAQNAQWIMPTQDERLTLVTCAPYPQNTQRLIVVALPARTKDQRRATKDTRAWEFD